ncbi:MAG: hypothetical protein KF902_14550 [Phycisphaeraceae bacterium]|nr:hypothetical protein [Phycisphaeraceae bacterium]
MARRASTGTRGLSRLSVDDLQAEIVRRGRALSKLKKQHAKAMQKVEAIEREIIANGGGIGGSRRLRFGGPGVNLGRKRPKNDMNLAEALQKTLKGKTMGVTEVTAAVQKNGYKTSAENFRTIVNQTLIKHPKIFKKIARGQYSA